MQKTKGKANKGITLIALVITIIVLIILAGISISLVLGQNGLFNKAKSAATETTKARFLEDAGFAYSEAYIEKAEKSDSNAVTIEDIVSKLKSGYGYTDDQIKMVSVGVTDINLSETDIKLEPGETKDITVTLGNGTYYVLIENLYYPITLSNDGITLGEGLKELSGGEETTNEVTATPDNDLVNVTVKGTTITIITNEDKEGQVTITVTCASISKKITVNIKSKFKQGEEVPLGDVTVTVNDKQQTLAQSWKYFYDDEDNNKVWLIYSGNLEKEILLFENGVYLSSNGGLRSSKREDLINYLNGEGSYTTSWDHIKTGIKDALNAKAISINEDEIIVKGSPDIELFQKAYKQMYPKETFLIKKNSNGWQYYYGNSGYQNEVTIADFKSKTLFFTESGRYYIASPSADTAYAERVCGVNCSNGYLSCYSTNAGSYSLTARPVVSIPKTVFDQLVGN